MLYLVGGHNRDMILGCESQDKDYVVTNTSREELLNRGFEEVAEHFPVFLHPETRNEWALPRSDDPEKDTTDISIEEDLQHRDFTINAIAKNTETGELIDPYNGQEDIENRVLKHLPHAFENDPVRLVRLATFAARYPSFTVHENTVKQAQSKVHLLDSVAPERVTKELLKTFRVADDPVRFFEILQDISALEVLFPELENLTDVPAGPTQYHQEGSAFRHTLCVMNEVHKMDSNNERLLFAALGHDLGKGVTDQEILPNHYGHDEAGVDVANNLAARLKLSNIETSLLKDGSRSHMKIKKVCDMRDSTLIQFVSKRYSGRKRLTMSELFQLNKADYRGRIPSYTPEMSEEKELVRLAIQAIKSVSGQTILDKFDVDGSEGSKIQDLILQERIKEYRSLKEQK